MTDTPVISVIIPCYNGETTLPDLLNSLASQTNDCVFEVLVADNGSTDQSRQVAESYAERFSCLQVVDASGVKGAGHARNQGVKAAQTDRFAFIDADDVAAKGWVLAIYRALNEHAFVASRHEGRFLNSSDQLAQRQMPQSDGLQEYTEPPFLPHSGGCGLGVHRSVHDGVGGFDEAWLKLQDTDYCWRVQLAGTPLVFVPEATVHVRMREGSSQSYRQAFRWAHYNVRLYKRFRPLGMPKLSWKRGLRWWLYHLSPPYVIKQLKDKQRRPRWFWQISWRFGRLVGSIRYLTWAL